MNELEVKKELYKSKVMAKFSHYVSGNLYYNVEVKGENFQFPISTIESANDGDFGIQLSSDLGTTSFDAEVKGSELNRWISKAIKNGEFIKVS